MEAMTAQPTISGRVPTWTQGDFLRKARMSAGMTTRELAEATGISEKTINNYENERVTPRRPAIIAWAFATGVDLEWLEKGTSPQPGTPVEGTDTETKLPRLDSNQQHSGYRDLTALVAA